MKVLPSRDIIIIASGQAGRQAGAWSMDRWMAIEMQIEFHGGSDWGAIIQ